MGWRATARLRGSLLIVGVGLVAGLAAGRPAALALAAPFAVLLLWGLSAPLPQVPRARVELAAERILEGGSTEAAVQIETTTPVDLALLPPDPLGALPPRSIATSQTVRYALKPSRWGAHRLGELRIRAHSRAGLFALSGRVETPAAIRVYPRPERLATGVAAKRTQASEGSRVSRAHGEGMEFAELRPFASGDHARRINARVSARRGVPYVTERHPERNSDVVIVLDTFAELKRGAAGSLDLAVHAALSLAERHLLERDRVGVVGFGGTLRWLEPGLGLRQRYRVADTLLESEIAFSYAWKTIDLVPARILPTGALVVAISPLLDDRAIAAFTDLALRRHDLVVLEVSPEALLAPATAPREEVARRLWELERELTRSRLVRLGVPVVALRSEDQLATTITEVNRWRRHTRAAA
jgi:uncharacterized protein (DUF58 family)